MRFAFTRRSMLGLAFALAALPTLTVAIRTGRGRHRLRRREPQERARRCRRGLQGARPARACSSAMPPATRSPSRSRKAAPADIFFSADLAWMDYLDERNLIRKDTRAARSSATRSCSSRPTDSTAAVTIGPGMDLAALLGADGSLAMANVDSVPAGKYGKAALETLGIWASVADASSRPTMCAPRSPSSRPGEAPLGIVYRTDANAEPKVKVLATFPRRQPPADPLPGGDDRGRPPIPTREPSSIHHGGPTRRSPPTRSRASPSSRRQADVRHGRAGSRGILSHAAPCSTR